MHPIVRTMLLVLGSLMLFGGGMCVVTNLVFAFGNLNDLTFAFTLLSISAGVAWAGWGIVKLTGGFRSSDSTGKQSTDSK